MPKSTPVILIADDSRVNVALLNELLSQYQIISITSGSEVIAKANSQPQPDLILLDVTLPDMAGYETCRRLKESEATRDIPVMFITLQNEEDSITKGFDAGAVDYITKPFRTLELQARVKSQLAIKIARDQNQELHRKIAEINQQQTDSIVYAKKLQDACMPKASFLNKVMPEHFILHKPKDIVSGDFYWIAKVKNKLVIVAADCTGHGVPGASMSMFGVAYLREIIEVKGVLQPSLILDNLRNVVIDAFQENADSEVKDGMDMSVISIDIKNKTMEYAGAFNPLYLIRNGELTIIPADNIPVAFSELQHPFTNQEMMLQKGDCLYLFSDGFASQFGGPNDKKLKQKNFQQLIIQHSHLSMHQQKEKLNAFFESWKGEKEQTDDVLLMGIRI